MDEHRTGDDVTDRTIEDKVKDLDARVNSLEDAAQSAVGQVEKHIDSVRSIYDLIGLIKIVIGHLRGIGRGK
jgi:hypothetical protein